MARFLRKKHGNHYFVLNLSGREYNYAHFGNRVISAGFPDHHAPPLSLVWCIYSIIDYWLALDEQNVVAVHCLAGAYCMLEMSYRERTDWFADLLYTANARFL